MSNGRRTASRRRLARPGAVAPNFDALRDALNLFQAGEWAQAEPLCRSVIANHPNHPGALTLLGVILAQSGRRGEAVDILGRAVACAPGDPQTHNNYGNALRDCGRHLQALPCYKRALALKPDYAEAHYNLGLTQYGLRQYEEAIESYRRALTWKPDYAAAWNNLGTALRDVARWVEALSSYDRALALQPDHVDAHNNRGAVLYKLERLDEALDSCTQALALSPNHAGALNNHGVLLHALGRAEEALANYDRALALKPDDADAHNNRGITLNDLERYAEALESFARTIALAPDHLAALMNRAETLKNLKRFADALASFDQALSMNPRFADAHARRGMILCDLNRFQEALASLDQAIFLGKRDAEVYRNRGVVMERLRYDEEAVTSYDFALALDPRAPFLRGIARHARMGLCNWNGLESDVAELVGGIERGEAVITPFALLALLDSPSLQLKAAEVWVREQCSPRAQMGPLARHPRHDKIRIGYFSADFHNHAVGALAAELFELHDRSRFELTAFSLGMDVRDELRTRIEAAFDRFLSLGDKCDHDVTALARRLEIDIAVDLGGYTRNARPRIFALRAAPVQASYLGYLGTMGGEFMDYLFADPVLVPPDARQYYSEKIAYLPSYQVNDSKRPRPDRPLTRADLGLPASGFVFCCFNASFKINPETFGSWMRILAAVPASVLFLLGTNETIRYNLRQRAADHGIDPERLVFGGTLPFGQYLARYGAADLFLDTLPYNAGTTASDALWSGLPVLTCRGESFAGRMAASLLTAVGLPELITDSRADYERLAIEFAGDPVRISLLKQRLGGALRETLLFDTSAFTRNLEALYERMYARSQAGELPDHLQECRVVGDPETLRFASGAHLPSTPPPVLVASMRAPAKATIAPRIRVTCATRKSREEFFSGTALGRSLSRQMPQGVELRLFPRNTQGLPAVYNVAISECQQEDVALLFIHDDVHICDFYWADRLLEGLEAFDVVGLVGNRRRVAAQPAWCFMDEKLTRDQHENFSGVIGHGSALAPECIDAFGPSRQAVKLLDGVFMAVKSSTLRSKSLRFDERFDFHFYDMDLCRQAERAGLTMGTWPISVIHESTGNFGGAHWLEAYLGYLEKWGE